ncbi:hypothetical protein HLB44_05180 [Aquincola sp. S2]|uniref:Uncharacterized protein n=1 Tax=Pseudaquabacterium terrae TaxID=2732868 RepID=A0ABX2ED03_9BURK|nr:hypothetical protein [Aquabacterium terrae]NRF66372.1 hypothetical protein [Aquabacterium terrae]
MPVRMLPQRLRCTALAAALLVGAATAGAQRPRSEREELARSLLPDVPLRIGLRCATEAPAAPAPGSVTTGTTGSTEMPGARTWRSSAAAPDAPLLEVTVANGELGSLRWQDGRAPQREYELVGAWLPSPGASAPRGGAPRGAITLQPSSRPDAQRELQVEPRWPGGSEPVRITVVTRQTTDSAPAAARPGWSLQTVLQVPLERWTTLARAVDGGAPGCALQVKVSRTGR